MVEPRPYSAADFRHRVAERFGSGRGPDVGDHILSPELTERFMAQTYRHAAVLVPVVGREPDATVLLTQRTGHLRAHAGQIAFPGGTIDAADAGPEQCALRETFEEIGLDPNFVEPLALAPDYLTGSGYRITPVLALVQPDFRLTINPDEVSDAFEVPLSFLMNPTNHRKGSREWAGATRYFFEMPFGDRHVWGITAGIVRTIYERLYSDGPHHAAGVAL